MKFWLLTLIQNQVLWFAMYKKKKKLEKAKFAPPPVWLEDQVRRQQMLCGSRAVITNTGQQNPLISLLSLFISWPEKDHGFQVHQM